MEGSDLFILLIDITVVTDDLATQGALVKYGWEFYLMTFGSNLVRYGAQWHGAMCHNNNEIYTEPSLDSLWNQIHSSRLEVLNYYS